MKKRNSAARKTSGKTTAHRIKLCGKDNAPLSMNEIRAGLYEAIKKLEPYSAGYRAKWVTLYLTVVDETGDVVRLNQKGEWIIYPYKSAADEFGA